MIKNDLNKLYFNSKILYKVMLVMLSLFQTHVCLYNKLEVDWLSILSLSFLLLQVTISKLKYDIRTLNFQHFHSNSYDTRQNICKKFEAFRGIMNEKTTYMFKKKKQCLKRTSKTNTSYCIPDLNWNINNYLRGKQQLMVRDLEIDKTVKNF